MSDPNVNDPEVNSQFAEGKRRAAEMGTPPGVDPETGERAAITFRQLYNETGGDEKRAREIFDRVAKAGGYGDMRDATPDLALDIKSIGRMNETIKDALNRGVDLEGKPLDLYARRKLEQQAQHHDAMNNEVREIIREFEKG
jgi:hypothetical protein